MATTIILKIKTIKPYNNRNNIITITMETIEIIKTTIIMVRI